MYRNKLLVVLGLVALLAAAPASARIDFTPIEGGEFVVPNDMSADGSIIVLSGYFGAPYFTWTADEGLVNINGGGSGGQISISDDGSTIVGNDMNDEGVYEAARYDGDGMWTTMGSEPGGLPCGSGVSSAYDTNNHTAVGLFWRAQLCKAIGGTWDVIAGVAGPELTSTVPNRPTRGNGITDDGTIVVGWQDSEVGNRLAVKWVNGVQEHILTEAGEPNGEAIGVNSDGTVIWGTSYRYAGTGLGWLWVEGEGFTQMGTGAIGRSIQSVPLDATEDGNTVIGITRYFDTFTQWGWIWTEKKGWQNFDEYIKGNKAKGWSQMIPSAISHDGRFIAGYGINPDGTVQGWVLDQKATGN
jgi:uncharacterized membrane protein